MGSVAVLPEIPDDLFDRYDRLAKATGRPIDVCMIEALAGSTSLSANTESLGVPRPAAPTRCGRPSQPSLGEGTGSQS